VEVEDAREGDGDGARQEADEREERERADGEVGDGDRNRRGGDPRGALRQAVPPEDDIGSFPERGGGGPGERPNEDGDAEAPRDGCGGEHGVAEADDRPSGSERCARGDGGEVDAGEALVGERPTYDGSRT
jgi:hypothetical protein